MANPLKVLPGTPTTERPSVTQAAVPTDPRPKTTNTGGGTGGRAGAANATAAARLNQQAQDMQAQIKALKDAIKNEFKRGRKQNLQDVSLMLSQNLGILTEGAQQRGDIFLDWASDTEKATGDVQEAGFRNLVRERADSMSAILEQGAGETDATRAMLMNARNWNANASEANRTYFDTMQSINQGIVDMNIDTKTGLANTHMTAEGQREGIWQDFYNRRSEAMTALGNTYGDQMTLMGQAQDLIPKPGKGKGKDKPLFAGGGVLPGTKTFRDEGDKGDGKGAKGKRKAMQGAFAASSNELGKSYVEKPLPEWIDNWEGTALQKRRQENTNLAAAPTMENVQRAQGATLRTWG